jgi:hypothetical protein
MMLMEFDKAGAEWVVVAYLSGDVNMIDVVNGPDSPHTITGSLISGAPKEFVLKEQKIVGLNSDADVIAKLREKLNIEDHWFLPRTMSIRQAGKKSNHGLNYKMSYLRFALETELANPEAKRIVELYHSQAYPGISTWWESVRRQLNDNRSLVNCFGRRRRFMDAWGEDLFKEAYAFLPQSTVVDMVNRGMVSLYEDASNDFKPVELLAQVHDSVLVQYPTNDWQAAGRMAVRLGWDYLRPLIQYGQREFYIETDLKIGHDWGHMYEVDIPNDPEQAAINLEEAWESINAKKAA